MKWEHYTMPRRCCQVGDNRLIVEFPADYAVSQQQREEYGSNPSYREKVHHLWTVLKADSRPTGLKNAGYDYLLAKWYQVKEWSTNPNQPSMSAEFKDLIFFAQYVGPKIQEHHHLDRINPHLGYGTGNVRWADDETKASNKRKSRYHEHMGSRLTDRELSVVFMQKGVTYNPDSIKHFRQYWQRQGLPLPEITQRLFEKHGLPYNRSEIGRAHV